ncbi:MAG: hypothetical protein E7174_02550 [Firmicutes bacterium]|nr:hypothetical protein [Bacillota bacterium]
MEKNGQYVGVDEKYIPEEEKYVDGSLLGKDTIEKAKPYAKKGLKIVKGAFIGYTIFFVIFFAIVVTIIAVTFVNMKETGTKSNNNAYSEIEKNSFNRTFETYTGTQSGFFVTSLLDKVSTNNKKEKDHIITVIYNNQTTTIPDEIISIKQSLESRNNYEVSFDYDQNGFINKVTMQNIN